MPLDLHALTPDQLRARRTLKWTAYPADLLPMWVAEMDFPVCHAVSYTHLDVYKRQILGKSLASRSRHARLWS